MASLFRKRARNDGRFDNRFPQDTAPNFCLPDVYLLIASGLGISAGTGLHVHNASCRGAGPKTIKSQTYKEFVAVSCRGWRTVYRWSTGMQTAGIATPELGKVYLRCPHGRHPSDFNHLPNARPDSHAAGPILLGNQYTANNRRVHRSKLMTRMNFKHCQTLPSQ